MFVYASNATLSQIARRILAAQRVLVTTHLKPDGDALGACLALTRALTNLKITAHLYVAGPIEHSLRTIAADTPLRRLEDGLPGDDYDLAVVVDTGAWSQLELIAPWLKPRHDRIVGIDHHSRGDDIASVRFVDPKAVSTTAILTLLLDEMKCELTGGIGGIAEALFVGLATDSGWFRYENAGPQAFAIAARLLARGVNKSRLYQIIEETFGPQRLALEARALTSLEYARQGTAAIQSLRPEDFKATGASLEDVTGLVNTPMTVGKVRVSVLLTQTTPGMTKISLRSKPPPPDGAADDFVDVNALAAQFGGGGHVHAAGARLPLDLEPAKAKVIEAIERVPLR